MIWEKEEFTIENKQCTSYACPNPKYLLIQPVDDHDLEVLDLEIKELSKQVDEPFLLVALKIDHWNQQLSPWIGKAIFGKEDFGDGAQVTLTFIETILLPGIIKKYELNKNIPIILGGYSLAGLFSLWGAYQTKQFSAIVATSPSVWFYNWLDYINEHQIITNTVYLSLGDKEERTKNKTMSRVGQVIRAQSEILKQQGITTILEWNEGGHFQNSALRLAKGFAWAIINLK